MSLSKRVKIVGVIITFNEERRIERAVTSLRAVTDDIVVVDSESTDATQEIAERLGAEVVTHSFEGFSAQRRWALEYVVEAHGPDFVLSLDADEWLTSELVSDLRHRVQSDCLDADIYLVNLRIGFDGRLLRWGGFANTWLPRLFRPGSATYETREVNEHLAASEGVSIERLLGYVVNDDVDSWEDHIAKHNRYSTLEAKARIRLGDGSKRHITAADAVRLPYMRRRWIRQHIWDRLPARPALRFAQIYVLAGGFLDGRAGFRRALFEAWQEMCTDLKAEAMRAGRPP